MKRLVLIALAAATLGVPGASHAECARAGGYDTVYVKVGNVEISGYQFGNALAGGPARACTDTSVTQEGTEGLLSIKVDGVEVCHRTDTRVSADPFFFGIGIHATGGTCGADVSLGNLQFANTTPETITGASVPDGYNPNAAGMDGVALGVILASPVSGHWWIDGNDEAVPAGTLGFYSRGAKAEILS